MKSPMDDSTTRCRRNFTPPTAPRNFARDPPIGITIYNVVLPLITVSLHSVLLAICERSVVLNPACCLPHSLIKGVDKTELTPKAL